MASPQFFVVARVVGSDGAFAKWQERLVPLCEVSATEAQGTSYYWAQDLDGEPDTLWGLEGYTHPVGFFLGHPSSDIFKREMALVDGDKLLRHEQGLSSRDYDLHHYDFESGYLKLEKDADGDFKSSHVAVEHFWAKDKKRREVMDKLTNFSNELRDAQEPGDVRIQSCAILKECVWKYGNLTTLWIRTKTREDYTVLQESKAYKSIKKDLQPILDRTELHQARGFNGHIDQKPQSEE